MLTLTRPEGTKPEDLNVSRRAVAGVFFGGYAVYALSADAEPISTDSAGLITERVMVPAGDRAIPAFVARPAAKGRFPVVMLVCEVFGIHEYIRDTCRRLAKLGYAVIAPDFFARTGDPSTISDFAEIRRIVSAQSEDQVMGDIAGTLAFLKKQGWADKKKLAITGFCWGGAVVWLAVARFKAFKAGAAWYGRLSAPKPGEFLGEPTRHWPLALVGQLNAPVIGFYGGKDAGIPKTDVDAMNAALAAAKKKDSQIIWYPDAQHGFHADYRSSYNAADATDAWARMLAYFSAHGVAGKPPKT